MKTRARRERVTHVQPRMLSVGAWAKATVVARARTPGRRGRGGRRNEVAAVRVCSGAVMAYGLRAHEQFPNVKGKGGGPNLTENKETQTVAKKGNRNTGPMCQLDFEIHCTNTVLTGRVGGFDRTLLPLSPVRNRELQNCSCHDRICLLHHDQT